MTHDAFRFSFAAALVLVLAACTPDPGPVASPSPPPVTSTPSPTSPTPTPTPSLTAAPTPNAPPSTEDPAPSRVAGVAAVTGGGSGEVLIRWTPNTEADIAYYEVLRATTPGGPRIRIGTVTPAEVAEFEYVPFVDSNATVGYYRVRAVDSAGQRGDKSTEVCGAAPGHSC